MEKPIALPRFCGRTVLRLLADLDLVQLQLYRSDSDIALYQGWEQMTNDQALSFIQRTRRAGFLLPEQWFQLGRGDTSNGLLIGDIGICVDSSKKVAEVGFTLAKDYHRRCLARESVSEATNLIFK